MTKRNIGTNALSRNTLRDLKSDPNNARRHNPRNVGMIEDALREVGAARSIVIDENGVVLAGNATIEAAAAAGIENVQIIDADGETIIAVRRSGLTEEQKRRLALFDNRAAELADWDADVLAAMRDVGATDGMWFDEELEAIVGIVDGDGEPADDPGAQVDRAEELREKWQTERSQLWQIGRHRLLCGDATSSEDVARLLDGADVGALFTSPPYDQQRTYEGNMAPDWHELMVGVFSQAIRSMATDSQVFVNLGLTHRQGRVIRYWDSWIDWMESEGMPLFGWYVWDKMDGMPGDWSGRLAPAHEWIFHFTRSGVRPKKIIETKHTGKSVTSSQRNPDGSLKRFTGDGDPIQPFKIPDSVIRVAPQKPDEIINNHPAPFPVAIPAQFVAAWDISEWYDPFLGSGTTMVAAEQLGRTCYGMDIEPKYVALALERMAGMGLKPERID